MKKINLRTVSVETRQTIKKQVIALLKKGITHAVIAETIGISKPVVDKISKAYKGKGSACTKEKKRGRKFEEKRQLSPKQEKEIRQILIDKTKLTPARILVSYVVIGVILGAVGIYQPFLDFAGAGATVPLTGFGNLLAKGAVQKVKEIGLVGAFTGGTSAAAGGIAAAVFFGYIASLISKPKMKKQ